MITIISISKKGDQIIFEMIETKNFIKRQKVANMFTVVYKNATIKP